jgi:hypothetical protein
MGGLFRWEEVMKRIGAISFILIGFAAGIAFVYSCGGGGSSSSAAETGTVTITAAGSAAYLPSMSFTSAPTGWYGVMNVASSGQNYLFASANLPDGATITDFSYTAYDNDGSANTTAQLLRTDATLIASVDTSAWTGTTAAQSGTTTSISAPVVNNSNYGYFVRMDLTGGAAVGAIAVTIHYSL